ncbi:MAG: ABC transporter permease, partial [Oscillospiraceae bacterium]|nr:ABC transporter permease [Oscillospiraceae bacterium]
MKVANKPIIRKLTGRILRSDKRRNFFVIAAIVLTTFMIASVFSIGVSIYESINMRQRRLQGSVSHMAFANPTAEQIEKAYTLDYVKAVGIAAYVAQTTDFPRLNTLDMAFVDKTQWEEMFFPTFTNIIGNY